MLFWINPENSNRQNSSNIATYLSSHKSSEWDGQDMQGTGGKVLYSGSYHMTCGITEV